MEEKLDFTIKVSRKTARFLKSKKIANAETYDEIINRILIKVSNKEE